MSIFNTTYYSEGVTQILKDREYEKALQDDLKLRNTSAEKVIILRDEVKEITKHITNGIRDIIRQDRKIRDLVLNKGALPLATWADKLDSVSETSVLAFRNIINDMQYQLEHGKIQGFPGTMILYQKPTFITFDPFYTIVFSLLDSVSRSSERKLE